MESLPDYNKISFPEMKALRWEEIVPNATPPALALLQRMIILSSSKRISASKVRGDARGFAIFDRHPRYRHSHYRHPS